MPEPKTEDYKNFDMLQQSSVPLKQHGTTTQSGLLEENKGMLFEDSQYHSNNSLIQKTGVQSKSKNPYI